MDDKARVTLLGVRGSFPAADAALYGGYGCGTSCALFTAGGRAIVLDAGTGLMTLEAALHNYTLSDAAAAGSPAMAATALTVLLSHPHADHLLGLPACPLFFRADVRADVYAENRGGKGAFEQAAALMSPPLWPVSPGDFKAAMNWLPLPDGGMDIGAVRVDHAPGNHPGGVTLFRLTYSGKSVVYATDCELDARTQAALLPFAKGCDLLLCDAQYTPAEYARKVGWGHSSLDMALAFSAACGAGRTVLVHHAPYRTDRQLDQTAARLARERPDCAVGRQGDVYIL